MEADEHEEWMPESVIRWQFSVGESCETFVALLPGASAGAELSGTRAAALLHEWVALEAVEHGIQSIGFYDVLMRCLDERQNRIAI